jgi:hypothetical protein
VKFRYSSDEFDSTVRLFNKIALRLSGERFRFKIIKDREECIYKYAVEDGRKTVYLSKFSYLSPPFVDRSAFAFTICHEMGHGLGGQPSSQGASYEGQADYYASKTCMPEYFRRTSSVKVDSKERLSRDFETNVGELCRGAHINDESQSICIKTIIASALLIKGLARKNNDRIDVENLDQLESIPPSSKTLQFHPKLLCRYKTFIQAALGLERPSCWYNPEALAPSSESIIQFLPQH